MADAAVQVEVAPAGSRPVPDWHVLADGKMSTKRPAVPDVRRVITAVAGMSLLSLLGLLAVAAYVGHSAAQAEALRDVRRSTELLATAVLAPALNDAVLRGDPKALRRLDVLVDERVLTQPVERLKVWTADGRIAYSDEPKLIGQRFPLEDEELTALSDGETKSELVDLSDGAHPQDGEHREDGLRGRLLEVYTPVRTRSGQPLLVETYSPYTLVEERQAHVLELFLPILVVALVLLQLVQLPLAWALVQGLRASQREREHLLRQAIQASDNERRRIAGDLHDTVVQGLVGVSYVLSAAGERLDRGGLADVRGDLRASVRAVKESVRGLRSLLLEIYPAHVARAGLSAALEDLVSPLRQQGIAVDSRFEPVRTLRPEHEALLFRTAQEALRNVARHSGATSATVTLDREADSAVLRVEDDGSGFDVSEVLERTDGHVGLRVLEDLAQQAGCVLAVSSSPGCGTRLRLEVPRS